MIPIPKPGDTVLVEKAIKICTEHGYLGLVKRLKGEQDHLPDKWVFDGCSYWFQTFHEHPVYKVCFFHDVAYLVGGTDVDRMKADLKLALGLLEMTQDVTFSEVTLAGVRFGGRSAWRKSFWWGYGIKK